MTGFSVRPTVISSRVFLRNSDLSEPAGVATSRPMSSRWGFWNSDFSSVVLDPRVDPRVEPEDEDDVDEEAPLRPSCDLASSRAIGSSIAASSAALRRLISSRRRAAFSKSRSAAASRICFSSALRCACRLLPTRWPPSAKPLPATPEMSARTWSFS
ncbi:hypothetical protein D9M70_496620 [compost metagenome]